MVDIPVVQNFGCSSVVKDKILDKVRLYMEKLLPLVFYLSISYVEILQLNQQVSSHNSLVFRVSPQPAV